MLKLFTNYMISKKLEQIQTHYHVISGDEWIINSNKLNIISLKSNSSNQTTDSSKSYHISIRSNKLKTKITPKKRTRKQIKARNKCTVDSDLNLLIRCCKIESKIRSKHKRRELNKNIANQMLEMKQKWGFVGITHGGSLGFEGFWSEVNEALFLGGLYI